MSDAPKGTPKGSRKTLDPSTEGRSRLGPDPVWGVFLGAVGLLNMAIAGALTMHWWFNVSEAVMMLGAFVFIASVAWTSLTQEPLDLRQKLRELKGSDDDD